MKVKVRTAFGTFFHLLNEDFFSQNCNIKRSPMSTVEQTREVNQIEETKNLRLVIQTMEFLVEGKKR